MTARTSIFFNATAAGLSEDVEIRAILDYIMTQRASDSFTERIKEFVEKVKADERAKGEYMIEPLIIQDSKREGRKEGRLEGRREKAVEAARNFKENGVDIQLIAKCVGLSVEEVKKL